MLTRDEIEQAADDLVRAEAGGDRSGCCRAAIRR
jgi:hypothetical protein